LRIREYNSTDLDALRRMHAAQGFGYSFPDLNSPLFISKLVLEESDDDDDTAEPGDEALGDEGRELTDADFPLEAASSTTIPRAPPSRISSRRNSRVTMAILQRLTAETYLLHDPGAGTPRQRWQRFLALHDAARLHAAARGLDDVQAFLPPRIARAFGRRLARLGWTRDPWPCFSRRVP
jgi:hypothetical protein